MTTEFIWQLPTSGDARHGDASWTRRGERHNTARAPFTAGVSDPRRNAFNFFDYLHQIARAADLTGFDGIQIQHDLNGDESWIVAGYVARSTRHVKLLTEFEASRGSSVYAAKNAASYQRFSGSRFAWQLSRGGDAQQRRQQGDHIADADILPRIEEFLTVARGVLTTSPFTFKGCFFEVLDGGFKGPLANRKVPPVYLSGNDDEALQFSARVADTHIFEAATLQQLAPAIARLNALASDAQRQVAAGLRIDVLARESEEEAIHDANRFLQQQLQQQPQQQTSTTRQSSIAHAPIATNVWAPFAGSRTGAAAALVGSYEQIADRISEYAAAGVSSFVLSALPHLEETYRIGENVLPRARQRIATRSHAA